MDNSLIALIDQLLARRLDIAQMFLRRLEIRPAQTKQELRTQVVALLGERPALAVPLQAFIDEYANAGRRRFYFSNQCDLNVATFDAWEPRIAALSKDQPVTLANVSRNGNGESLVFRFEFEQKRETKQPWPEVPPPLQLPDGSRVEYTATRIYDRPVLSTAHVYPSSGTVIYAIAQQEGSTDYNPILTSMWFQLSTVTDVTWPGKLSLQQLAQQLSRNRRVDTSQEKRKTPNGSVNLTHDRHNASVDNDQTLRAMRASVPANHPHVSMRCCWSSQRHRGIQQDMILWLNARDGFLNLRQDATPGDTDYVLNEIRRLL